MPGLLGSPSVDYAAVLSLRTTKMNSGPPRVGKNREEYVCPLSRWKFFLAGRNGPSGFFAVRVIMPPPLPNISAVEVAHPGFVNFRLSDSWLETQVEVILASPETYGCVDLLLGFGLLLWHLNSP